MTAQRADAAARRALILDAADHVFGQHGVTAPLDLVVERAQVGRATLYRNFPDRTALIQALLQRTVDRIRRQVEQLGDPAARDQKNARMPNATPRPGSGE